MATRPRAYTDYYVHQPFADSHHHLSSPFSSQAILLHHPHEQFMSHHSQHHPPSPPIPIDPALSLYPPQFYQYPQMSMHQSHPGVSAGISSPSSHGSETMGTPPQDTISFGAGSNGNGKRPASANSLSADSRKKARKDDDADPPSPSADKGDEPKAKPTRGARACTVCRRLKMKCVGAENGGPCKRCQTGNHECIFEESNRGKRSTKKHEILTRSLRKMERTLDTVLRSLGNPIASGMVSQSPSPSPHQTQATRELLASPSPPPSRSLTPMHGHPPTSPKLHSLPDNSLNPLGLLAEASLANRRSQAASGSTPADASASNGGRRLGVAHESYFKPGPMTLLPLRRLFIERQIQPEMLSFVTTEEVVELFKIYFDRLNLQVPFLDPEFHTPSLVCSRSPFLLTSICAVASRFYEARSDLHAKLTELTRKLAFSVPAKGYKSVEIVQAYLINTLWGTTGPVQRFEQDQTWMLLGMAIRMATDLNLHRRSTAQSADTPDGRTRDREVRNRERTWIICFVLDRSYSAQMGKPYTIKEDYIIRNASQWARSHGAIISDYLLAGYADLQRIVTRSLDLLYSGTTNSSGLQVDCDFLLVIKTMETQLLAWQHEWVNARRARTENEYWNRYCELSAKYHFNYAMLIINAFGLQNAMERSAVDIGHFFARCHSAAATCATTIKDMGASGHLKYASDSFFVTGSYSVLTLLKLIRSEFSAFLDHEQQTISLVNDVANAFEQTAVSPTHSPALYGGLLRALIAARTLSGPNDTSVSQYPADGSSVHQEQSIASGAVQAFQGDGDFGPNSAFNFSYNGEMGPVEDISTFPPTMAPNPSDTDMGMLAMDNILSADFWESVLVPGSSNSMETISSGFVHGIGGTGLITPRMWMSPLPSGQSSPSRPHHQGQTQESGMEFSALNAAFMQPMSQPIELST